MHQRNVVSERPTGAGRRQAERPLPFLFRLALADFSCVRAVVRLWGEPLVIGDCTYIFLDSEGLGSTDQTASFDTQLFSLSLLLSSLFILNTSGTINENALEQLELVVQMTERIKVGGGSGGKGSKQGSFSEQPGAASSSPSGGGGQDLAALAHFFPAFLWILRDFSLELTNAAGQPISPNEYLEDALRPTASTKKGAAEKNRIRQAIRSVFESRQCVTLVRPVAEERDLQRVSSLGAGQLRNEFASQIQSLKAMIPSLAAPKSIDGVQLNGKAFVALANSYIASINAGSVPTIRTAFANVQEIQGREAVDAAWAEIQAQVARQITSQGDSHVFAEEELESILNAIQARALAIIHDQCLGSAEDVRKFEESFLSKHAHPLFASVREANRSRAEKGCADIVESLWIESGIEDHLANYTSYAALNKDVQGFWTQYLRLSAKLGNARNAADVGRTFLDKKRELIFKHLFSRIAQGVTELQKANAANEANQAAVAKLTGELQSVRSNGEIALRKLELELDASTKESSKLERALADSECARKSAETQLQSASTSHKQGLAQLAAKDKEIASLGTLVLKAEEDVKKLERANTQLQAQLAGATNEAASASAAAKAAAALEKELAQAQSAARKAEAKAKDLAADLSRAQASLAQSESDANAINQRLADETDAQAAKLKETQQELAATKAQLKRKSSEAEDMAAQQQQQIVQLQREIASLQSQLQSASAASASPSHHNPLGLPTPTKTPLVSRHSLIPSSFSSGAGAGAGDAAVPPAKRKTAAAAAASAVREEDYDQDQDMGGGGGGYGDESDEDDDGAAAAAPASRSKPASAAGASATASSLPAGTSLKDPSSLTIAALKSWLTSLDVSFPQKPQSKAWYVDLAYEKVPGLEAAFPRGGAKAKKSKN